MNIRKRKKLFSLLLSLVLTLTMIPMMTGMAYADDTREKITAVEFDMKDYTPKYGDKLDRYAFALEFGTDTFATVGSPAYFNNGMGSWYKKVDGEWKRASDLGEEKFQEGIYCYTVQIRTDSYSYHTEANGNNGTTHVLGDPCTVKVNGVSWETMTNPVFGDDYCYNWTTSPEYVVKNEPPHEHNYTKSITEATPTTDGFIKEVCEECNDVKAETVIPKVSDIYLSAASYTYSGGVKSPTVIVKDSEGNVLKNGTDYTVTTPSGRKNVGAYMYKITLKGNYSGTVSTSFTINPKGASIKTPTKAKKAFTAKWSKQSAKMSKYRITGYQVQYSTNKNFSEAKTVSVKGYTKSSKKISKLKAKTTYYVKIRTYMTVSGKNYYSDWSKVKSVKTK